MDNIDKIINQTLNGKGDSDQLTAAIFGVALTTRGSKFLELGVRSGLTTLPLLEACKHLNAKLTSVDIDHPSFSCPSDLIPHWNFVRSEAIHFLSENKEKFDLIFIDDWHDGKHVSKEIELLEPFCDKSTVILLHDLMYGWKNPEYTDIESGSLINWGLPEEFDNGGPCRAVFSLDRDKWEYASLPFCNGLTLLRKTK